MTAVIVGGSIKGKAFALDNARELGRQIRALKERIGGSVLITDSKRTGSRAEALIMEELKGIPAHTYLWGSQDENPIMGYWALADNIVVTGDSVSMACESCGAGKPVFVFCGHDWLTPKHCRLFSLSMIMATPCLCSQAAKNLNREKFCSPPLK